MNKKFIVTACAVALAVGIGVGSAVPATAAESLTYPNGGKWYWQYTQSILESNYYHSTRTHRSSVTTPYVYVNSGWKSMGAWSYANTYPNPGGGNVCNYALA